MQQHTFYSLLSTTSRFHKPAGKPSVMLPFLRGSPSLIFNSLPTQRHSSWTNAGSPPPPCTLFSFVPSQTFTSTQPVLTDSLDLTHLFGVMALGAFIRAHVREELSRGRWSGRAKRWQMRTPCKQGGSWGTCALARTFGLQLVVLAQQLRCLFHSTGRWTPDHPKLPHCLQLSYISHISWEKKKQFNSYTFKLQESINRELCIWRKM